MNAEQYVSTFLRLGKRTNDLNRIRTLLKAVGDPQQGMRFIHIAGTNGKGSMAQMFSEIFTHAGYTTGLFTSPYIIEYSDRIRVNGENISRKELDDIAEIVRPVLDSHSMRNAFSQFEVTQAIAFLHFKNCGCDVVVLEAGLGGLLDSTNAIEEPLLSVIGSVDFDHTAILGDTIEQIAFQKAGIIKSDCPCVLSPGNRPEVNAIVAERALEAGSQLVIPDISECEVLESGICGSRFVYRGREYNTPMAGEHQIRNAVTVIEGIKLVGGSLPVPEESISGGISKASICGRIEVISRSPLIILDGAHNPDGMRALSRVLSELEGMKIRAVIGMHRDKNAFDAVNMLTDKVSLFTAVDGFSDNDIPAEELAQIIRSAGGKANAAEHGIMEEIRRCVSEDPAGVTLVCGSLYLAAYVHKHLKSVES